MLDSGGLFSQRMSLHDLRLLAKEGSNLIGMLRPGLGRGTARGSTCVVGSERRMAAVGATSLPFDAASATRPRAQLFATSPHSKTAAPRLRL